jgi:hypothetical protein
LSLRQITDLAAPKGASVIGTFVAEVRTFDQTLAEEGAIGLIAMTASVSELEEEIARLRDLDLPGLRARWRLVFRRKAPDHLPRHLLYRMIAYRPQAQRLGDLDRGYPALP